MRLHVCLLVVPFGEMRHKLQSSPHFLKPLIILRGPRFGGSFARINKSRKFLDLLYDTTEGLLKHFFIVVELSHITRQCFFIIFDIGGKNGWKVVTSAVLFSFVLDTRLIASLRSIC